MAVFDRYGQIPPLYIIFLSILKYVHLDLKAQKGKYLFFPIPTRHIFRKFEIDFSQKLQIRLVWKNSHSADIFFRGIRTGLFICTSNRKIGKKTLNFEWETPKRLNSIFE